jgi:hypothetical protein
LWLQGRERVLPDESNLEKKALKFAAGTGKFLEDYSKVYLTI